MFNKIGDFIKKKKKVLISGGALLVVIVISTAILMNKSIPTLKLQAPNEKISSTYKDEIIVSAVLSELPNNLYPAASVSIKFDKDKLEFVDLAMGTMQAYNDYDTARDLEPAYKIPQWIYNVEVANQEGEIRAMYLDTTAGKNAYVKEGFEKKKRDMPFKLVFKLKDSVIPDDKLVIEIEEAVFATVEGDTDKSTLSTKDNYGKLKVKDAVIKIED